MYAGFEIEKLHGEHVHSCYRQLNKKQLINSYNSFPPLILSISKKIDNYLYYPALFRCNSSNNAFHFLLKRDLSMLLSIDHWILL